MESNILHQNAWIVAENMFRSIVLASFAPSIRVYFEFQSIAAMFMRQCVEIVFEEAISDIDGRVIQLVALMRKHPELMEYFATLTDLETACKSLFTMYLGLLLSPRFKIGEMDISVSGSDQYTAGVLAECDFSVSERSRVQELRGHTVPITQEDHELLIKAGVDFSVACVGTKYIIVCGPISLCNASCPDHTTLINHNNWKACFWRRDGRIAKGTPISLQYCNQDCRLECTFRNWFCLFPGCKNRCCVGMCLYACGVVLYS